MNRRSLLTFRPTSVNCYEIKSIYMKTQVMFIVSSDRNFPEDVMHGAKSRQKYVKCFLGSIFKNGFGATEACEFCRRSYISNLVYITTEWQRETTSGENVQQQKQIKKIWYFNRREINDIKTMLTFQPISKNMLEEKLHN